MTFPLLDESRRAKSTLLLDAPDRRVFMSPEHSGVRRSDVVYHLGRITETDGDAGAYAGHSEGHVRQTLIGRACGSPHQEVVIGELAAGGGVARHLHAFEEAIYVLEGQLTVEIAGSHEALAADDYVFIDRGVAHTLVNESQAPCRWFEVCAPQPGAALEDTAFIDGEAPAVAVEVPYRRDHFDVAALPAPSESIGLSGFGGANVGRASLKILVGPDTGASQFNLMVVQYASGGYINEHDHAFEEGFFFLEGEVEAELEGQAHMLEAGDYCWSSVGSMHALHNRSDGIVRWLETQVPQPPSRYQARFIGDWERFLAGGSS
jgi:quercetin dioxygenase-like cupin family protein